MLSPFDSICCFTSYHVVSNNKEPGIDGHFDDCTKELLTGLEDSDSDTNEEVQSNTDPSVGARAIKL